MLAQHPLGDGATAIVVDFHAEATSEKMAFGHFADGRVSAVVGTHTHVPTADAQILPGGTAYHQRCRHVRRLRFGDRHGERRRRCAASSPRCRARRPQAGRGRGDAVRRLRRDRRGDRPGAPNRAGAGRRPSCAARSGARDRAGADARFVPGVAPILPYWLVRPTPTQRRLMAGGRVGPSRTIQELGRGWLAIRNSRTSCTARARRTKSAARSSPSSSAN